MRKITATITTDRGTGRYTFGLDAATGMVAVWSRTAQLGLYRVDRFNGGRFGRDWIRELTGPDATVTF